MADQPPLSVGDFSRIYDPSVGEAEPWYVNDHTFIRAEDGTWHLFGITRQEPAKPFEEVFLAHATAPDVTGPWSKQPPVMPIDPAAGETHIWAPHVIAHGGRYWMFYCGGGASPRDYRIHLATSADLWTWERHAANPLVVDGYEARDPMVLWLGDRWAMYYTATSAPEGGHHTVHAVFSDDLVHWSGRVEVYRHWLEGTGGGPTESPFVVRRGDRWLLFVCTNKDYVDTAVFESESPLHWEHARRVLRFASHAAEIIDAGDGRWFASHCGWGQGGVYLAPLTWAP